MHQIQFRLGLRPPQTDPARFRNDLYCVDWDVKLYYTIPYPDPAGWACSISPDPLADFNGPTSTERKGRAGEGRGGKGKGGGTPWFLLTPLDVKSWIKPWRWWCRLPYTSHSTKELICRLFMRIESRAQSQQITCVSI